MNEFAKSVPSDTSHLRFLEAVELPATLGTTTIAQSVEIFPDYLDPDFQNWGTDVPSQDTAPATALIYEMKKDGNFKTLFDSFGEGWESRLPTQGQIVAFCQEHPDKLRQDGYGTFFAFRVEGSSLPFVADVHLDVGQLVVDVDRLTYGFVWGAGVHRRVVVLQYDPESP